MKDHLFENFKRSLVLSVLCLFYFISVCLDIRNSYPKFAREFVKSSDVLEPFGIELAQVGNQKIGILQRLCAFI